MGKVYLVTSLYGDEYFNTVREVNSHKPGGEEPESVDRLDAAKECNRLLGYADDMELKFWQARSLLDELVYTADPNSSGVVDRVTAFLEANPLPPATAADRDGERSYGGG